MSIDICPYCGSELIHHKEVKWENAKTKEPPMNELLEVKGVTNGSRWRGYAIAVPYKAPLRGKVWRWMDSKSKYAAHDIKWWRRK